MRVLLVDDNRDILEFVQRLLLTAGYEVITARDGREALQQESRHNPDLIILDVNLPYMTGWEVCKQIKAKRNVPILLVTVRAEQQDIEHSFAVGADDHLAKPFEIKDFLNRVSRLTSTTGRARFLGETL